MILPVTTSSQTDPFAGAIRNPENANHFMVVQEVSNRVQVFVGERKVAETRKALRVLEVGKKVYDPAIYISQTDITAPLSFGDRTTHCPLKGDASYATIDGREVAWRYQTLEFAERLKDHVSFSRDMVRLVEGE